MKRNILEQFIEKLLTFPLLVKQIVYLRLYKDLALSLSEDFISVQEKDLFHVHIPTLSFNGKTELLDRPGGFEPNFYTFLESVSKGLSMLEISMNNFWTIEEVAKFYVACVEASFFKPIESVQINATAGFMSGRLRIGEYFKRIGKIDVDQLERVIVKQKEYFAQGLSKKMAEVMIEFGYITEMDVHSLLICKEEAQKRFILDESIVPSICQQHSTNDSEYKAQIDKLTEQNNQLKDQLRKLLAFVKKNG